MIVTTTKIYCDRCGTDVTHKYSGSLTILIRNGHTDEVEPNGNCFCEKCMKSFNAWMKEGKKK